MKLVKAMATVAGLTGLSRIAGFVRDILTAAILGAGPVADAFIVALKLPNFFRRITAEGAFSVSFVPVYSETLEREGTKSADKFAGDAFAMMLALLSAFTAAAMLSMPGIIAALAPGFESGETRFGLAVELSRITFPYLLLMSLTALLGGVLNARGRFAPFAFAPVLFNLSLIGALLSAELFSTAGHALAWGVALAGVVQLGWMYFCAVRAGFRLALSLPRFTVKIRRVFALMGPGVIGAGVMHINLFADVIIASLLPEGAIASLYFADRLNQLPLGMVGIAVGTALLPLLSRAIAAGDTRESADLFNRAMEYCLLLALPAAVGLLTISGPLVVTLFHHGAFSWEAAGRASAALTAYAIGLPAYIWVKVLSTGFWARQDTLRPVYVSVGATLFNIALSLWLVLKMDFGVAGIALGTGIAGWLQAGALWYLLRRREGVRFDARFIRNGLKIAAGCGLMAAALLALKSRVIPVFQPAGGDDLSTQILALSALIGTGVVLYTAFVLLSGAVRLSDLRKMLKKRR